MIFIAIYYHDYEAIIIILLIIIIFLLNIMTQKSNTVHNITLCLYIYSLFSTNDINVFAIFAVGFSM